jgi:hypothetical protein
MIVSLPAIEINSIAHFYIPRRYDIDCHMYQIIKSNSMKKCCDVSDNKISEKKFNGGFNFIHCNDYFDYVPPLHRVKKLTKIRRLYLSGSISYFRNYLMNWRRIWYECVRWMFLLIFKIYSYEACINVNYLFKPPPPPVFLKLLSL